MVCNGFEERVRAQPLAKEIRKAEKERAKGEGNSELFFAAKKKEKRVAINRNCARQSLKSARNPVIAALFNDTLALRNPPGQLDALKNEETLEILGFARLELNRK